VVRNLLLLSVVLVLVSCGDTQPAASPISCDQVAGCSSPSPPPSPTPPALAHGCLAPNDPAAHVYHPDRLQVLSPCITALGTIAFERKEADGDYHIGLALDAQYAGLVNACNSTCLNGAEHGDLVLEPVCELPVTQADAVSACAGYHNPLVVPRVGGHVSVTGAYVLDLAHGWTEIHPVVALTVTPA
jgi:hypothetical protein